MDDFEPVVIDNGSWSIKAGFGDDPGPAARIPTQIGRPHIPTPDLKSHYIGSDIQAHRELLALKNPIDRGLITNWADMEELWRYTFHNALQVNQNDHPVVLSESVSATKGNRERTAEIMFETFQTPRLSILNSALLTLYACGRTTGVVVDAGHGSTHVAIFSDGALLNNITNRLFVGGSDINLYLNKLFNERGISFATHERRNWLIDIKEHHAIACSSSQQYSNLLRDYESGIATSKTQPTSEIDQHFSQKTYKLPDGNEICIESEHFRCTEPFFQPDLLGLEQLGLGKAVFSSIVRSDINLRRELYSNVILSGGSAQLRGFPTRLKNDIVELVPDGARNAVKVDLVDINSTWVGAALISSINLPLIWLDHQQYQETGLRNYFYHQ